MLERMPLLEQLEMEGWWLYQQFHKNVDLPKLKKIKLDGFVTEILEYLTANSLVHVDFKPLMPTHSTSKAELVSGFLMKFQNIKMLKSAQA